MEILFLWVGLVFLFIGRLIASAASRQAGTVVEGRLIGYVERSDGDGGRMYAPVVSYPHPRLGRQVMESAMRSGIVAHEVGAPLMVRVEDGPQARARLDSPAFWWFGAVLMGLGAVSAAAFFLAFHVNPVNLALAAFVSVMIVLETRRKSNFAALSKVQDLVAQALTPASVPESMFDKSRLVRPERLQEIKSGNSKASLAAGAILVLICAGLMTWSYLWNEKREAFLAKALPAAGRVVSLESSTDSEGGTTWSPIVEYPFGRFKHPVGSSPPSWRVGQDVRVLYDPGAPGKAMIDQGRWNRMAPIMPAAIGALLGSLGLLILLKR